MIPLPADPRWWLTRDGVAHAARHLRTQLATRYPEAARCAADDPTGVCDHIIDLDLELQPTPPSGACPVGAVYEPLPAPARIRMRPTGGRRDGFTILHEIGHHLMYTDHWWSLTVRPTLPQGKDRVVGEKVANAFAASVLLPNAQVGSVFADGVSATAIRQLHRHSQASAAACCVRALDEPGQRLVMLASLDGRPWFADSHGMPYNPGTKLTQPLIGRAIERAGMDGTAHVTGGQGIVYSTGRIDTDVILEVAVDGGYVFAIATSTPQDSRLSVEFTNEITCSHCDETFTPVDSTQRCLACSSWRCPACGQCDCERPASYCQRCFIELAVADVQAGHTNCEEHR